MKGFLSLLKFIERNFGWMLFFFAAVAFVFPHLFLWAGEHADIFIMLSLFLGCLKIDFSELVHLKNNLPKMLFFVVFNLVVYPAVFYVLSFFVPHEMRIGVFMVLAISGAVMTPLLASFMNLKILWAVSYVVISSLLVPFSLPLMIELMFGISLDLSISTMILFLMKVVFIPVFSAFVIRLLFGERIKNVTKFTGAIGTTAISIFLGVVIAKYQVDLLASMFKINTLWVVLLVTFFYFLRFIIGWLLPADEDKERWTNALMFGNLNTGLAIIIAVEFFSPEIIFVVLLSEVPYVLSQPLFQKAFSRWHKVAT